MASDTPSPTPRRWRRGAAAPSRRAVRAGVVAAAALVAAIGVALLGDVAATDDVLDVPAAGEARVAELSNGTPVMVTRDDEDAVHVLDARLPYADEPTPARGPEPAQVVGLLGWCDSGSRGPTLVEPLGVRSWDAAGLPQVGAFGAEPDGPQARRALTSYALERAGQGPVRVGERQDPPRDVEPVQLPWPSGCPPEETATPPLRGERVSLEAAEEAATLPDGRYRVEAAVEQIDDVVRWCPLTDAGAEAAAARGEGRDVDWPMPLCEDGATLAAAHSWDGVASSGDAVARVGEVGVVVADGEVTRIDVPADAQLAFGPVSGQVRLEGRLLSREQGEQRDGSWRSITPGEEPDGAGDAALTGVRVLDWGDARGEPQAMPRGRGIKVQLWFADAPELDVPSLLDPQTDDVDALLAALEGVALPEAPTVEVWVDRVSGEVTRVREGGLTAERASDTDADAGAP